MGTYMQDGARVLVFQDLGVKVMLKDSFVLTVVISVVSFCTVKHVRRAESHFNNYMFSLCACST